MQKGFKKLLSTLIVFGMVVSSFTSSVTPTYGEDIAGQPTTETTAETPTTEEANQTTETNNDTTAESETTPSEQTTEQASNTEDTTKEETVSYPAQNFSKSAGNVTVHVSAVEGIFPEGTTMTVTPVSDETATQIANQTISGNEKVKDAIGVDITFYDSSGNEIEPKDGQGVQVQMQLNTNLKGENFAVVHQEDNGNVQTVTQDASAQGATFNANAFSIYVITGIGTEEQDPAVATYQFHDANGNVISSQKVKNGETLTTPQTPEKEGNIFKGWATSQDATEANVDITQPVTVDKTSTVDLYPVFSQKLYVFFTDEFGRVVNTKEGVPGDVISTSDVSIPLGSEKSVTGWYTDKELTNKADTVTLEDHNVTLYPKVESGHYLYLSTGDNGSYIAPQFVEAGKTTQQPTNPTRPGYTFEGWSTTEGGSANYTFGQTLTDSQTIYAVWEANKETKYTVIYWWQNANDNKYSFHESKIEKGTTGSQITFEKKSYDGFNLNSDKTNQENANKTIAGDGSTIVNVYYDRQVYTIKFYHYVGYVFNGSWQEYTDRQITAKYGANIADQWPSDLAKIWGTTRQGSSADKPYQSGISTMPLDGDEFYKLEENGRYTMNLNYYIEGLNDDQYVLDHTDRFRSDSNRWSTTSEDHYDIEGFTYTGNVEDGSNFEKVNSNTYEVNFRYKRNSYAINFINGDDTKTRTETYKYEADISNVDLSTTPDRPDGVPEGYKFVGWYDNELGVGDKVTLPSKMPAHNITLYAKWEAPTYIATVHTTIDGNGTTIPIEVTYGEKIDPSSLPTVKDADGKILSAGSGTTITLPENTEWIGWSTKDGDKYINFNLNTKIYNDIELYPYYLSTKKYKVTYDVNGGTGSVADSKEYASGSYADIQSASGLKAPNKKSFLYWSTKADGTGTTYYPDDKIKVTEDITLYAIYGDPAKTTSLTYHSNYPSETGLNEVTKKQSINGSEDLENNASFKAYSNTEAGMQTPDGYYFDGWKDSKGQSIQAGQTIGVDTTDSNDLYAQWKKKESLLIEVKGNNDSHVYDGENHSVSGYTLSYTVDGKTVSGLPDGLTLNEDAAKERKATGKDVGTYKIGLTEGDFKVTGSDANKYTVAIKVTDGQLLITKRAVHLKSESATKTYDGTPLTRPDVDVTGAGFVKGEVSDIKATGTITKVGSVTNTITYTKNDSFKADNYDITKDEGTLTITKNEKEIVVTAKNATKTYDGKALTEEGYEVAGLPEGYTAKATTEGSIKDVGTAENKIASVKIMKGKEDVTDQFKTITKNNGTLTVNKRNVTLTSQSATKQYDGTALTAPDVTVTGDGFVEGEVSDIEAIGTITKVGNVKNEITYTTKDGFKAGNYDITKNEGTLTITPNTAEITVTAKSAEKTYDGKALSAGYEITGLPEGFKAEATTEGSITNVGSTENKITSVKIMKDDKDVTNQFNNIKTVNGTLTVNPRKVTLTSESKSKAYDGTALIAPEVKVTGDGFVKGEVSDIKATGTITKVGSVTNTITYTKNDSFKADNYDITKDEGTLTITKNEKEIVVTAKNATKTYDGTPLTEKGSDVTGLPEGYTPVVETSGSITDAGSTENKIASVKIMKGKEDVTDQFKTITKVDGKLTVNKRNVTLTSQSATKQYDGTALTAPDVTVTGDGFVDGEVSDITATGTITEVGNVKNEITYTTKDGFKAGNYDITKNEGTLVITPNTAEITVTAKSAEKTYDGKALSAGYEITGLPEGFKAEATTEGSITNVGSTENKITSVKIMKDDKDVTNQFNNIKTVNGTLTVNPRKVTLTSESKSKAYDGTALIAPEVKVTGDGFVEGEVRDIKATGTITKVGSVTNTITYKENEAFKAKNYDITKDEGTLTITKNEKEIVVTAKNATKTYDGKALTEEGYEVAGLPEGYTAKATTEGSIKDVGTAENKIASVKIMKGKEDVTDQFKTITKNNGTLTVNKRNVTLTSQSATKQYDGTALTAPDVTVTGDGFVEGEVSDIEAIGTITKVGNVKNEITYTTKDGFKADNYDITKNEGTLTITPNTAEITVTAKSAEKTYDGKALSEDGYDVAGLPEGFKAEATTEGSITNVDSTENKITSVKIMKDDKDVTNQFNNIKTVNGTLTVNPRKVTLTSESKSKAYDGTALIAPEVKVTGDGFVEGEVSDIKATGTITKVGSVTNTITYTKNDSFKADNYDITKDEGTLTITKNEKEIVVTAKNATKTYDGTPLTEKGSDVTGLPEGYTPVVETSGSITDAGSTENKITSVKIMKGKEDVTDQFKTITKVDGKLTVNKRNVTLTSQSATKQYDGIALTAPDVTVTGDGFVDGEVSDIEAIGTIKKVGSVTNTITYTTGKAFNENNYTITKNEGKLKITQNAAEITVKASSAEKIYDGTALVSNSYKVTGLPEGFKVETSVTGQRTNVGTVDNVLGDVVIKKDGQDVTNQFSNVSKENGKLTVKKRTVNLKSESATKTYDGTALTRPDVTVTGDGFLNTEVTNVRAIGSITKVGKVTNTIDYDANSRFDVNNYDIHISEGTLEITPYTKQISVTAKSAEKTYDGKALTEDGYDVAGLSKGFRAEATTEGSITDVGSIENKITSIKIMKGDEDVTDQFTNIKTVNGTLTVTKRTVNLKSESDSKKYDGTALTSPKVTVTGDGFVEGEVSDIKATGSITKVGSTPNTITYTENDGFKADNYTITKDEGTLTITQSENEIVVTAKNATKTYDGKALSAGYDITGLPEGYTAEVTTEGSITDVGSTENKIASVKIMKGDEDVTDQFKTITKNNGTLTVTKRNVTLTSQSATKQYDGTALTAPDVTVTGDGFVEGEVSDITATGSITKVGNVKNEITYTTKDGFKADNYDITKKEGTLTITANANEIVVTAKDADKKYDGKELSQSGYDVTGLPEGFTAIVKTSGSIIDAGKADNVIKDIVIKKGDDDVTDQFSNIKTVNGTLTVNPRKVTLTSESASKTYDGTPLTSTKVSVTGDGFVEGEVSDIKATGSQMYVGSSKNDITYKKEKNFKDKNYIITLNKGKLTVTDKDVPSDLVVTKKHDSKTYKVGDTITFTIEVTNIYDKAKTITIVEQDDVQITGEKVFTNVAPGATVKTTATHVVTKEDVDAKEYKNVVTAKFDGGKDFDGHDKEDQFDRLEISKTVTSTPKDGQLYRNGETISYKITVKNTGTTVAKNVNVTDDLTGLNETVDELGAGEEKSFDTTYVVTDKDVHAGHIKNVATATSDGNDPVKDEVDTPVETAKPSLIVEKTSDKDHPVKLNETIHYTVTVTNNGNVTIENVTVDDELTDNHWKAGTLKPGESKTFDTTYKVTETDIEKGKVVNVATADGEDSTGDKPDVTPGEVTNETEEKNPHLTLTKTTTSTPQNKAGYAKGETITYRIKAENDGNVVLHNIKVEDPLTKDTWTVESLKPGESKTWTTCYVVTEADQTKGSVVNDVTATAKTSTGDDPIIVPGHTSDKVLTPAKVTKETKNNDTTNTGVATFGGTYAAAMLAAAGLLMSLKRRRDDE